MLKKKIFSLVLVVIVLTIFACADRNNRNIEPYTEVVEPVKEYIEEMISEDATLVDSTCRVQYESVSDKKNQIMSSSVNAQAYTYCITSGEDQTFYTIFAVEVSEKITQNDHLEISINDYLLNYSPEDGRVFSKKDQTSGWAKTRDITPVATDISHENTITVFGSEIESDELHLSKSLSVSAVDLCAVLGNQIENAIEANANVTDTSKRYVRVILTQREGFFISKVLNFAEENPFAADGTLNTRKPDKKLHGLGIKSIENTVEKYNGYLRNSYAENCFVSEALMCNK